MTLAGQRQAGAAEESDVHQGVTPADRLAAHASPGPPVTARNPAPGLQRLKPTITAAMRATTQARAYHST